MESKYFWLVLFIACIFVANFASSKAGKNVVADFDKKIDEMPFWKKIGLGIIDFYPYSLLTDVGKKWQTLVLVLFPVFIFSGYNLSILVGK